MTSLRDILKNQKAALPYDFKYLGTIHLKDTNIYSCYEFKKEKLTKEN